jgi:hypothetical protein
MRLALLVIIAVTMIYAAQAVVPEPIPYPNPVAGNRPYTVQFQDNTVTAPACTIWNWDFGDGESSTLQNPSHIFWKGDLNFTITFSCTNTDGTGSNVTYVQVNEMYRPKASATVQVEPTEAYTAVMQAIGGNASFTGSFPSFLTIIAASLTPYTAVFGNIALVIVFLIPFLMMWLMQRNLTLPGVIGIVLGGIIYTRLPSEYQLVSIAFIALSITAIIYSLLKERM